MSSNNTDLDNFVGLSAVLTGFSADDLNPQFSPAPVAVEYLQTLQSKVDAQLVSRLLSTYQAIAAEPPDAQPALVHAQILQDPDLGPVARNIIRMWYLSIWYTDYQGMVTGFSDGVVVSSNAYTKGLAWDAMQAHPMGYSEMHYGYWADPPEGATGGDSQGGNS
jgi:Membrane bound FAD containing D-sorbitol dehydrogenase